jgi:hypothetical protein
MSEKNRTAKIVEVRRDNTRPVGWYKVTIDWEPVNAVNRGHVYYANATDALDAYRQGMDIIERFTGGSSKTMCHERKADETKLKSMRDV